MGLKMVNSQKTMPATLSALVQRRMNSRKNLQVNFCNEMNEFQQISFLQILGKPIAGIFFTIQFLQDAGYFYVLYIIQCIKRIAHGIEQTVTADVP